MSKSYGINAAGEAADVKRGDSPGFWPEDLLPFTDNYRFASSDTDPVVLAERDQEIEEMVISLVAERQKHPIGIHEVSGKRFKVHFGDTRHQAALRVNQRRIWPWNKPEDEAADPEIRGRMRLACTVESFGVNTEREIFESSITENLTRNNLTVIDLCGAVARAEKFGYTPVEILAKFHQKDPAWLQHMRQLYRLPIARKREIHLGILKANVGYVLAEIPEEFHEEILTAAVTEEPPVEDQHPKPAGANEPKPLATRKPKKHKVTARAVATAAKKRGLLRHRRVAHTVAGMRQFWKDQKGSRNEFMNALADAELAWINSGEAGDDTHYRAIMKLLRSKAKDKAPARRKSKAA